MSSETQTTPEGTFHMKAEGDWTIYRAAELLPEIVAALGAHDILEIDLAKVAEFDSAGFQLLLVAKQEAARRHKSLRLLNHSEPVREVLGLYHMEAWFGDPIVIPAHS
jgi:anti-anti-sigma factor